MRKLRVLERSWTSSVGRLEQPVVAYADCQSQVRGSTARNEVEESIDMHFVVYPSCMNIARKEAEASEGTSREDGKF